MNLPTPPSRPLVAAVLYAGAIAALVGFALSTALDLSEGEQRLEGLRQRLAALEGRRPATVRGAGDAGGAPAGSPFLEARSVTLAGAALQQRMEQAVARAGGEIASEQIDLQGPDAKDGFIGLTASLDIAQPALQTLLYDIEAGAPYLIVQSLDVQSPLATGGDAQGPMRVTLALSGKWEAKP